jgi:hypothetical protein
MRREWSRIAHGRKAIASPGREKSKSAVFIEFKGGAGIEG